MQARNRGLKAVRRLADETAAQNVNKPELGRLAPAMKQTDAPPAGLPPPSLSDVVLEGLKKAGIRKLSRIQFQIIAALAAASDGRVIRAVAEKLSDRLLGLAIGVVELLQKRPSASVIVVSSAREGPSTVLHQLESRINELWGDGSSVVALQTTSTGDGINARTRVTLASTEAFSAIPSALWASCTHFVLLHEGGPDSERPMHFPDVFRAGSAVRLVVVPHAVHLEAALARSTSSKTEAPVVQPQTNRTNVSLPSVCCDGGMRLQSLLAMLPQLTVGREPGQGKAVVLVASREMASFLYDLLCALQSSAESQLPYALLCDWETNQTDSAEVHSAFERATTATVLISAFGFTNTASAVVQYDSFSLACLARLLRESSEASRRLVVFLYPSELRPLTAALAATGVEVVQVDPPSAARLGLLHAKAKSTVKRTFILAAKAFSAYKATVTIYSKLAPTSIFNVRNLALDQLAAQFGLDEVPLLDLRMKDNTFRPKRDLFRDASKRSRQLQRETLEKQANVPVEASDSDEEYWNEGKRARARVEK